MRLVVVAAIAGLAIASLSIATGAEAASKRYELNIPRQSLDSALKEFARQTGLQIARFSDTVDGGALVGPVSGALSADQALQTLLSSSGLTYRVINERTIAVLHPGDLPLTQSGTSFAPDSPAPSASAGVVDATATTSASDRSPRGLRVAQASDAPATDKSRNADSTEKEEPVAGEVLVTGSHIKGQEVKSTPKREYTRQDIERTGAQTTEDFLRTLPLNFNGGRNVLGDRAANPFDNFANNSRMTTANIHGLAVASTLSLVNGRRMAPLSVGGDFDISVIPMAAVERVEIITDGASAIYGSDAIAGVVNFILRDDFDGAETSVQYGKSADTGYDETQASQIFGKNWRSGGGMLAYEFYDRGEVTSDERDYTNPPVPGSTLVDPDRRHSFSGSIHQSISDRAVLSLDALYTKRGGRSLNNNFGGAVQNFDVKYHTASPSLDLQLGRGWSMNLAGTFGGANEDIFVTFGPLAIGFDTHNTYNAGDLTFNGSLFSLPAGEVNVAIGGQYRKEEEKSIDDSGVDKVSRNVKAEFLELLVPLASASAPIGPIREAQLSLAVRHEKYSDVGASTDPRIGLSFSPAQGLNLRSTYGTSFKAPSFSFSQPAEYLNILDAPDPNSGQTETVIFYGGTASGIEPEQAKSWTAGFDWNPPALEGFTANVTYYDIVFKGRISGPVIFAQEFLVDQNLYAPFIEYSPSQDEIDSLLGRITTVFNSHGPFTAADIYALLDGRVRNLARTKTSGMDLQFGYRFDSLGGQLNLTADATHVIKFDNQPLGEGLVSHDANRLYRPLSWRGRLGATWSRAGLSLSSFINYANSYKDTNSEPDRSVSSWTTLDLNARYSFGKESSIDGLSIFVNARNLFNKDPPFVASGFNGFFYDGANADPLGRVVSAGLSYRW